MRIYLRTSYCLLHSTAIRYGLSTEQDNTAMLMWLQSSGMGASRNFCKGKRAHIRRSKDPPPMRHFPGGGGLGAYSCPLRAPMPSGYNYTYSVIEQHVRAWHQHAQ